jgi:hypothetical protein
MKHQTQKAMIYACIIPKTDFFKLLKREYVTSLRITAG